MESSLDLTVYFAHRPTAAEQGTGFGVEFQWDIDLTSGYRHVFLENVSRTPALERFGGCDTPEIARIIERERFDAFMVWGWNTRSYWQAMRACWRTQTPVLVRSDSQIDPGQRALNRWAKRAAYPLFMRRFAACLSVGQRSEEYFRLHGARRIVRVPHFVDNEFFANASSVARRDASRSRWSIEPEALVFLFAGKLIPKKRPLDLIHAAELLGRSDVCLLIAGDGELRARCEREARDRSVTARFTGFLNQRQMPAAYAAADVLVLSSDARETWGLVVNEGMASGLPAVVSDAAGCAPDLVVDGQTGYRFEVGDIGALAAAMERLASASSRREMALAAARHVASFSVQAATRGFMQAFAAAAR